jgi:hypothetical protein
LHAGLLRSLQKIGESRHPLVDAMALPSPRPGQCDAARWVTLVDADERAATTWTVR